MPPKDRNYVQHDEIEGFMAWVMYRVYIVVAIKAFCGGRTMIEVSSDESGYKTLGSFMTAEKPT